MYDFASGCWRWYAFMFFAGFKKEYSGNSVLKYRMAGTGMEKEKVFYHFIKVFVHLRKIKPINI